MAISITNESKNSLTLTNEGKAPTETTWSDATYSWNDATGTWNIPGLVVPSDSKNILTLTNETKN